MGRKDTQDPPQDALSSDDHTGPESASSLAKRHLQEALERKQQSLAGRGGGGKLLAKGSAPHHPNGPAKGRNFRHQGR